MRQLFNSSVDPWPSLASTESYRNGPRPGAGRDDGKANVSLKTKGGITITKKEYSREELDAMSQVDLYKLAQEEDLAGRSTMDKDQLAAALDQHFNGGPAESGAQPAAGGADLAPSKEDVESVGKTDHTKSANENAAAGGQPTGRVPGGTS